MSAKPLKQEEDAETWLKNHIYVPVIAGVVVLAVLVLLIYCCVRNRRRKNSYLYKRLEYDMALAEQMDRERTQRQEEVRDSAYLKCQYYLRGHPNYSDIVQQTDLGSRIDKHWFRVRDSKHGVERMLNIVPYNPKMVLPFSRATCKTLKDLFSLMQHPYIFPTTDFDFALEQKYIIIIQPISMRGSLKDYIYQSRFQDSWFNKYSQKRRGLMLPQVQQFGRQILEALSYLEEKGFPAHGNVHSGNVMFQDGVCRLSGYENAFLGNTSRVVPLIKKKLKDENKDAVDILSFGHLLFEMCFGFELDVAHPEPYHLVNAQSPAVVEILNYIFQNPDKKYPSIRQICQHAFFSQVQLVELMRYNPAPIILSPAMKTALKAVKKGKHLARRKSRNSSKTSSPLDLPTSPTAPTTPTLSTGPPPPPPPPPGAPPPPPPMPGPSPSGVPPPSAGGSDRSALLGSIRKGAKLKKIITNDRSSPKV